MDKTKYLVGAFLATALIVSGCGEEETETPVQQNTEKLAGQRLTDDSGVEYTLIDNGDGTETARYDDGRSVTFKRQEDGSLDFLSGTAGLLAGMAAGYFLFHGFSRPAGNWDASRNRYTVSEPLRRNDQPNSPGGSGAGRPSTNSSTNANAATNSNASTNKPAAASNTTPAATSNTNSNSGKVNLSKDTAPKPAASSSTNSSAKTGFGTAGARGGSSSAAS